MQLKHKPGALRLGLMAASCSLLGAPALADAPVDAGEAPADAASSGEQPWQFDTGLLYYKENQGRVKTTEPVVSLRKDYGDEHVLGLSFAYDSLSGGSPNGALPAKRVQTFATPSGTSWTPNTTPITVTGPSGTYVVQPKITFYTVPVGQLPLDPGFHDHRIAGDASWSQPFGDANHVSVGAHLSKELDFNSTGANFALSRDFDSKNTTLGVGFNMESDSVKPIGGTPVAGTDYHLLEKGGDQKKHVNGGLLTLSQVMSRTWITQLNLSYDRSHGYLTDPYKILSVVDGTGAVTGYRFESRPDSRARKAVYLGNKIAIGRTVLDLSVRHGSDDWSVRSNTIDGRWRFNLGNEDIYLEPHLRWYKQTAASFYHLYVDDGTTLPTYMSADPRLAEFAAKTIGLKLGFLLEDQNELTLRMEAYKQDPADSSSALANLAGLDLNPGLKSVIFQVSWRHGY